MEIPKEMIKDAIRDINNKINDVTSKLKEFDSLKDEEVRLYNLRSIYLDLIDLMDKQEEKASKRK